MGVCRFLEGMVSKLELIAAVSQEKSIADMLGIDGESLLSDEKSFDELHSLFEERFGCEMR